MGSLLLALLCLCIAASYATFTLPLTPLVHLLGDGEGHWGYGIEYAFNLEIGSPAQTVSVVLDSGSPGVIIYGSTCLMPECIGRDSFSIGNSSSWVSLDKNASANYIAGVLRGVYGVDEMWFAGHDVNMTVAVMNYVNWTMPYFANFNFSGIFGASMSPERARNISFVYQVFQQGVISQDIFGFMANVDPYGEGEVIFGGYNKNMTTRGITWHDVITFEPVPGRVIDWLWSLPATGLYVNGDSLNGNCTDPTNPCVVVVDTGGAMSKFTGPGMPTLAVEPDCSNFGDLPTVTLQINNQNLIFSPLDYVFKAIFSNGTASCVSNAFGVNGPEISATIAGRFFSKYYAIFNNGNQTVGFSQMRG